MLMVGELREAGRDDAVVWVETDGESPIAVGTKPVEIGEGVAPELAKFCRFMEVGADVVGVGLIGEALGEEGEVGGSAPPVVSNSGERGGQKIR